MVQPAPLSRTELFSVLNTYFDDQELRTLCFKLNVQYDDLPGEGEVAKARELVVWAERNSRLAEVEAEVRRERPNLDMNYSPERVQQLQTSILAGAQPAVRDAFVEFTQQIDAYLNSVNLLHAQLEEWKEVHNLLQDIQIAFAPCRGHRFTLANLKGSARTVQRQQEDILFRIDANWQPCKSNLRKLEEHAASIRVIGPAYDAKSGAGPEWLLQPKSKAAELDKALFEANVPALTEHLSVFGDLVDRFLYLADKMLRDVVSQINQLRRPGSYKGRS
jgi:Effector-associated domain 7